MLSSAEQTQLQRLVGDRYQPLALLGKKSGRKTLLAEDLETSAKVVIKLLTFGEDFAWEDLKLFEREAETLRSLDHAAIPKYLDYFDVETPRSKGFALVQDYIEARDRWKSKLRPGGTSARRSWNHLTRITMLSP